MRVQEQLLASRDQQRIVVFGELTSSGIDERHLAVVGKRINIGIGKHVLTRQSFDATMAIVKQRQHALVESAHQIGIGSRVHHTARSILQRISATIQLFLCQGRTKGVYSGVKVFTIIHITRFLVVSQKQHIGLPFTM